MLAGRRATLEALGRDPQELVGRLDWVTKKWLLDAFAESEGLDWEKPEDRTWLQSQDLEYHNIAPAEGLYAMLEEQGQVEHLVTAEDILVAMVDPPATPGPIFAARRCRNSPPRCARSTGIVLSSPSTVAPRSSISRLVWTRR